MTHWYYHEPSQGRVGPIDADTLREHARAGRLQRDTLVWRVGLEGWLPLHRVEAELGLLDAPPPLPSGAVAPSSPAASPADPSAASAPAAGAYESSAAAPNAGAAASSALPSQSTPLSLQDDAPPTQGRADFSAALDAADLPRAQPQAAAPVSGPAAGATTAAAAGASAADAPAQPQRSVSPADYAPAHVARRQQAAPPPKRGMSGCLIALIVLAVLAVPVLGILAAIALPAYQDYTHRAKLAGVLAQAGSYKLQVAEHHLAHGGCPVNASPGFRPAADYAGPQLAGVEFGRFKDSGQCAIQLELRGFGNDRLDGHKLWLAFDPDRRQWTCSSDVEKQALLPQSCRQ